MARCQKCGSKIRKLSGTGKGSRWGCRRCLGILKMQRRYDAFDKRLAEILRKAPLNHFR